MEKRQLKPELIESGDGSHTLRVAELNEHYHSHKGAIRESEHVFLLKGLEYFPNDAKLHILEVGFGTGLNALLTCLRRGNRVIHYTSLEAFPLELDLIGKLNYPDLLGEENAHDTFNALHQADWEEGVAIYEGFRIEKMATTLESFECQESFDLVYYDAFAPHAQPELWDAKIWKKVFAMMKPRGVLVTYCAKGQVRRDMQSAGFLVERLEGPPGKREMIRAIKRDL